MDIPITLRFFEKLNLFLEVRRIDRENRPLWETEKKILSWAANPLHHGHLHTPLTIEMALQHEEITGLPHEDSNNNAQYMHICFGNLVVRGSASWSGLAEDGIRFTKNGFLIGEIVNDLQRRRGVHLAYYYFFYGLSWTIFLSGAVIVIAEALKVLWNPILHPICIVIKELFLHIWDYLRSLFARF